MIEPPEPIRHNRRAFLVAGGIGGATGGLWTTWFAQAVSGSRPQLFVVGDEEWQMVMIEERGTRVVVMSGEFVDSPRFALEKILGTLRQRIDVLIAPPSLTRFLPQLRRELDIPIREHLELGSGPDRSMRFGKTEIKLRTVHSSTWSADAQPARSWRITAVLDRCTIAICPSLEEMSEAETDSVLAIAPAGDPILFANRHRGVSCAVNEAAARDIFATPLVEGSVEQYLIRTYPEDIARFVAIGNRLELPRWAQRLR